MFKLLWNRSRTVLDSYCLNNDVPVTGIMYGRLINIRNISRICKNFFHCHKNTYKYTLCFGNNLFLKCRVGYYFDFFMTVEKVLVNEAVLTCWCLFYRKMLPIVYRKSLLGTVLVCTRSNSFFRLRKIMESLYHLWVLWKKKISLDHLLQVLFSSTSACAE